MVFFTQITVESEEDTEYLDAMRRANIKGALFGVEAVTPEVLKAVYKDFNYSGARPPGTAAPNIPQTRRACTWFVHPRLTHEQAKHLRCDGRVGA
jgi:hypothetical protein